MATAEFRGNRRLDTKNRAEGLIGQRVDEPIGARLHLADALLQLGQEDLAAGRIALGVELTRWMCWPVLSRIPPTNALPFHCGNLSPL